jgi:hypothetical protein
MEYPFAYILNLKRFPEKCKRTAKRLTDVGITNFVRWDAVDDLNVLPHR